MTGTSRRLVLGLAVLGACGTGDTRVDPADLDLRDLLGMSPTAATGWDADQRAAARKLITAGLHDSGDPVAVQIIGGPSQDVRIAKTLAELDAKRVRDGGPALGMVRLAIDTNMLSTTPTAAPRASAVAGGAPVTAEEIWLAEQWDQQNLTSLAGRGLDLMSGLALDAGHPSGPVVVVPVAHLAVVAGYLPGSPARLLVNPIVLAALEPNDTPTTTLSGGASASTQPSGTTTTALRKDPIDQLVTDHKAEIEKAVGGNPYSFYGSYEECAAAQRDRCTACVANGACHPITNTADGVAECNQLDADNGKGYYELCINLALAITSVNNCVASHAGSCPRNADAANSLSTLDANAEFLTDATCSDGLDTCLAQIFGAPSGTFPNPIGVDGGIVPPSDDPPRDVSPACGKGCSNQTSASPNCDCKGGNCGNSLTCSSGCAASNSQSGCSGDASGCDSGDETDSGSCESNGGDTGGNDSCSGSNDSDTGSCSSDNSGDSCSGGSSESSGGSCDNSGSSSDSCGSGSSTDSCSSSDSSGGGCDSGGDSSSCGSSSSSSSGCGSSSGGDSCGGSSGSSGCSSSGSSSGCSAAKKEPSAVLAIAVSASWGLMPVPIAAFMRRRARKRKATKEVQS